MSSTYSRSIAANQAPNIPPHTLGPAACDSAARALVDHHGITVHGDLDAALASGEGYYLWQGEFPGGSGRYWIPALFRAADLPSIVKDVATQKRISESAALDSVRRWHTGLKKDRVALSLAAAAEIDHLSREQQEAAYRALSEATGLRWGVWCWSGGKSIHAYLLFDHPLDPSDPLREEIQRLLIVCLCADPEISDPGRLMRLPGWDGPDRQQPIIHLDPQARYAPEDIRDRLAVYASDLKITDVNQAVEVLRLATAVDKAAKESVGDGTYELACLAQRLRETRGSPDPMDLECALIATGRDPATSRGPSVRGGGTSGGGSRSGDVIRVAPSQLGPYEGAPKGSRHDCPVCGHRGTAVVMSEAGESPRLYCHHSDCKATILQDYGTPIETRIVAEPPPQDGPSDDEDLEGLLRGADEGRAYCPPIPGPGLHLLVWPTGAGKTTRIREYIQGRSCLYLTPTIRLTTAMAVAMHLPSYRDADGEILGHSAAVCLPSLYDRWSGGVPDVIVLDEVESLFSILHDPKIMGRRGVGGRKYSIIGPTLKKLYRLIRACLAAGGTVICADAHMSQRTLSIAQGWVDGITPVPPAEDTSAALQGIVTGKSAPDTNALLPTGVGPHICAPTPEDRRRHYRGVTEYRYSQREGLIAALRDAVAAGESAMVACDTRAQVWALEALLSEVASGDVLAIHRESEHPDEIWDDVDASFDQAQVVIYNTACGQGISYEGTRHRTVWLLAQPYLGWDALIQLRGRCRGATTVHSCVPVVRHRQGAPSLADVRLQIEARAQAAYLGLGGDPSLAHDDRAVVASWGWEEWLTRARRHGVSQAYYQEISSLGVEVVDVEPMGDAAAELLADEMSDLLDALRERRVDEVRGAALALGAALDHLRRTQDHLERGEALSLRKMVILDRWGLGGLGYGEVDDAVNRDARMWSEGRLFRAAVALGDDVASGALRADDLALGLAPDGVYRAALRGEMSRAKIIIRTLRDMGLDLAPLLAHCREVMVSPELRPPDPEADGFTDLGGGIWETRATFQQRSGDSLLAKIYSDQAKIESLTWSSASLAPLVSPSPKLAKIQGAFVPGWGHRPSKPHLLVGACLRALGVPYTRVTRRGGDGPRNSYRIDVEALMEWAEGNRRAYRRLRGDDVTDLGDVAAIASIRAGLLPPDEAEVDVRALLGLGDVGDEEEGEAPIPHEGEGPIPSGEAPLSLEEAPIPLEGEAPIHMDAAPSLSGESPLQREGTPIPLSLEEAVPPVTEDAPPPPLNNPSIL